MTFKELYKKEKDVVIHGQTLRFRLIKYLVLLGIFTAAYFWRGTQFVINLFFILFILSIGAHFFFRWKTQGWEKSWGLYKKIIPGVKKNSDDHAID